MSRWLEQEQHLVSCFANTTTWNPVMCARDELPHRKPQDHQAYVINMDDSHLPGTHWVVIYFPKEDCV